MYQSTKLFNHTLKLLLSAILFMCASTMLANGGITFLDQETTIMDRTTQSGDLLSNVLDDIDQGCKDSSLAEARDKLDKKLAEGDITEESEKFLKERAKRYFKCLKKAVKELKKSDDISKDEEKELKDIIKAAKKVGDVDDGEPAPTATINGRVTLPSGATLDAVDIMASSDSDTSAGLTVDGLFSLDLDPDTEYVLQFSGDDLADQVIPVKTPADGSTINIDITMIMRGEIQTFTAGSGNLSGADGASVDVNGIAWVDAMGNSVSGEISVTITPVDVSNSAIMAGFPGDFSGIDEVTGSEGDIVSYGTVEFEFTQNGQPLQPAAGQMVNILIPIYFDTDQNGVAFTGGEIIPLWSLNEATGVWEQEGSGLVVASPSSPSGWALDANVSHFSWWNCDVSMNAADATVTVFGIDAGTAVLMADAGSCNIGWRPSIVETVVALGLPVSGLNIPSNCEVCFSANITFADGSEATTDVVCETPASNESITVDLFSPVLGPLNITSSSSSLDGFITFPVDRVRLFPTSLETSVTYSITSGSLPAGLSLTQTSATQAEIAGVPTQAGLFSVTVEGNDGVETDSVTINYDISSDVPPPAFNNSFVYIFLFGLGDTYDMNQELDLVNGGAADNWELVQNIEGDPVPSWIDLDSTSGIITLTDENGGYWYGNVKASNAGGEDDVFMDVCAGINCEGDVAQ